MEKKHLAIGALVVVAIIGVLVYPYARFGLFTLQARTTIEKLGRFAEPDAILALPDALRQDAIRYKMDPGKVDVRIALEERSMMGAVAFTFVLVTVKEGGRTWSYSVGSQAGHRTEKPLEDYLHLQEQGIEIKRLAPPPSAEEDGG